VSVKNIILIMVLITIGYIYTTYMGEKPESLVADLVLTKEKDGGNIHLDFSGPVRHLGHFPEVEGNIIQIKLRAISFHKFQENFSVVDKFLLAGRAGDYFIQDIRYEGDVPGGPFVIIKFTKPMSYLVNEGDGLKGLLINYKSL